MPVSINNLGNVVIGSNANVVITNPISPIVQNGLVLNLDASILKSYPGFGTSWYDISDEGTITTLTNGPLFNSANGGYITYDGNNDSGIGNPSSTSLLNVGSTGNVTVEVVFRLSTMQFNPLFRYGNTGTNIQAYGTAVSGTGAISLTSGGNTTLITDSITTGIWYHTVIIFRPSPNPVLYYKNGISISTVQVLGPTAKLADIYYVGGNTVQFTSGDIGLVRVYNRELTVTEVKQNFNASRWRFGI